MCTYEDCTEGDQQYDNIKDWISHEVKAHRDTKLQPASPSDQAPATHGPSPDPKESLPQTRHLNPLSPCDIWREECPICLEKHPSFSHAALHFQKTAVFALPDSAGLDEDSTRGDQDSEAPNIEDPNSVSSLDAFEMSDENDLDQDETDDNWREWFRKEETRQKDVRRFGYALQQVNRSTEKGVNVDTFVAGVEPDNSPLNRGISNSDGPISGIHQPSSLTLAQISFYARIDPLESIYRAQPDRVKRPFHWDPPESQTGYNRRNGMLFRWVGGIMTHVALNNPVAQTHSAATIFTQNPEAPQLLVVPFDAEKKHVYLNNGGWRPLGFYHFRTNNTQRIYSAVSSVGDRRHIAAPGSRHWMPQLLPKVYDYQTEIPESPRIQAGLIGSIALLIALAAFSAPPEFLAPVLTGCLRPGVWRPHQWQYPSGRKYYCNMESST